MRYKIFFHHDNFSKYEPVEGIFDGVASCCTTEQLLHGIVFEYNENVLTEMPRISELDIIELGDVRRFRVTDGMFNELCSKPEDKYCQICSRFYLRREDVPKAKHMEVRNTFYKNKNNLCDKCFGTYGACKV